MNPRIQIPHTRILASAGSGKTWNLTNRFIRLMAAGEPPERILALTFTRQAAGEFFDAILLKLAAASSSTTGADSLAGHIPGPDGRPPAPAVFLSLLATLVERMDQLNLGTLDGFFHRILAQFSVELGLGADFALLRDGEVAEARQRLFRQLFQRSGLSPEARDAFLEAFKQATFGQEEKSLRRSLEDFVETHHALFLLAPQPELWADPARIWPHGQPDWSPAPDRPAAAARLLEHVRRQLPAGRVLQGWEKFLTQAATWNPGESEKPFAALSAAIESARQDLRAGQADIAYYRKSVRFAGAEAADLLGLLDALYTAELERKIARTRGTWAVLARWEELYHRRLRRLGRLTFDDIKRVLAGLDTSAHPPFSQEDHDLARLDLRFRLDATFDHWLLDEFQDTDRLQWLILQDLVDEVVMDPAGRRTFFLVGDGKQAIYRWRGGDVRLFDAVADRYNRGAPQPVIRDEPLHQSFRSCPAVIALINTLFDPAALAAISLPPATRAKWAQFWAPHTTARQTLTGCSAHLRVPLEASRTEATARLLLHLDPLARGLTCAVLTRSNKEVADHVQALRRLTPFPVLEEKKVPVAADHPLGTALLALLQVAAHPGDGLAWGHLLLTPAGAWLEQAGWNRDRLVSDTLDRISRGGFSAVLEFWIPNFAFSPDGAPPAAPDWAHRAELLRQTAEAFDATGERDPDAFQSFLRAETRRPPDTPGAIRVMTIHQSKGLGFDVVVLPELEEGLSTRNEGFGVRKNQEGAVEWILELPVQDVCQGDPTLRAFRAEQEAEDLYEGCCLFYVAATRARRGLYLLTSERKPNSEKRNWVAWIEAALPPGAAAGEHPEFPGVETAWLASDPAWYRAVAPPPAAPDPAGAAPPPPGLLPAPAPLPRRRPSTPEDEVSPASPFFGNPFHRPGDDPLARGSALHAAFETLAWAPLPDTPDWASLPPDLRRCLAEPAFARLLAPPPPGDVVELWREQAFDWVADGAWVSGIFDRVHLHRDPAGHPLRADILDFKTNLVRDPAHLAQLAAHYRPQMDAYRRALAALTGLSLSAIACHLLFTGPPAVVPV